PQIFEVVTRAEAYQLACIGIREEDNGQVIIGWSGSLAVQADERQIARTDESRPADGGEQQAGEQCRHRKQAPEGAARIDHKTPPQVRMSVCASCRRS